MHDYGLGRTVFTAFDLLAEATLAGADSLFANLLLHALDIVQPNITRAGGVTGLLAVDALCTKHGLALAPHGVGSAVGVSAALHACRAAGSFTRYEANRLLNPLRDELTQEPLLYADGAFTAQDLPGHGAVPKPDQLEAYALGPAAGGARHAAE